ncbi:MAG: membrane protein insertion efficiency factor YidD [Mojavia pulchra JT2-VF2]|jgi:putative component of membrane protein insertase Oxa1/YidC/SpoIIIJ protein YidD|uniref:Membrane protein insertion efficiency factor YidD n=1 Tax=Mojavia pulchra JT2-VF2 TaxID=287848 RepID=A0A951Q3V9_9NOST|nr:membrane protein insertion efficiency factor YidD [Mojavia pulchra JT2-VF2]
MQISLLDSFSRQVGVVAITGYQKHLSPHKGFVCAHRILYGGESCSQYIKRVITEDGFKALVVKSRERFQACKQANQILKSQAENLEPSEEEELDNELPKKLLNNHAKKSSLLKGGNSDSTYCVDCADASCNCAELVSMTPDCGSLDCSGADFGSLDCSGADCGSCG